MDGFSLAVAMIEQSRIDFRDALSALSLLHHAAREIGGDGRSVWKVTAEPQRRS